jgi:hypothetical protein
VIDAIRRPAGFEKRRAWTALRAPVRPHIAVTELLALRMPLTGDLFAATRLPRPLSAPSVSQFSLRSVV